MDPFREPHSSQDLRQPLFAAPSTCPQTALPAVSSPLTGVSLGGRVELSERVQSVRLLLVTLNDPYPRPRSLLVPDSGPAASRYVPCETCRQTGEVRVRGGWALCLACDGVGWKRREHGERPWD